MSNETTVSGIIIYCCDPRPEVRLWKRIKKEEIWAAQLNDHFRGKGSGLREGWKKKCKEMVKDMKQDFNKQFYGINKDTI